MSRSTSSCPSWPGARCCGRPGGALSDVEDAARPITLKDLLLHRAGIPYLLTAEGPMAGAIADFNALVLPGDLPMDAWIARLGALPLVHQPGRALVITDCRPTCWGC